MGWTRKHVQIVGAVNALLGALTLLGFACALVAWGVATLGTNWRDRYNIDAFVYWFWSTLILVSMLVGGTALFASGVAVRGRKPWGVFVALGAAAFWLLWTVVVFINHRELPFANWVLNSLLAGVVLTSLYPMYAVVALGLPLLRGEFTSVEEEAVTGTRWVIPRFSLRSLLLGTSALSLFFVVLGAASAGKFWALAVTLGVASGGVLFAAYAVVFMALWAWALVLGRSNPAWNSDASDLAPSSPTQYMAPTAQPRRQGSPFAVASPFAASPPSPPSSPGEA